MLPIMLLAIFLVPMASHRIYNVGHPMHMPVPIPYRPNFYVWVKRPPCPACEFRKALILVIREIPHCTTFLRILKLEETKEIFSDIVTKHAGGVTVLAPSDLGFSVLPNAADQFIEQLRGRQDQLREMLMYTMLPRKMYTGQFSKGDYIDSCHGGKVFVTDYDCINSGSFLNRDIDFEYGIVHVVNRVMYPVSRGPTWDIVSECPTFSRFSQFMLSAGTHNTVTDGPCTIFLPANEAFERLPPHINHSMTSDPAFMKQVLMNHVVPGIHYSRALGSGQIMTTHGGSHVGCETHNMFDGGLHSELDVTVKQVVSYGTGNILIPDIPCDNGVIHVIDTVQFHLASCQDPWNR